MEKTQHDITYNKLTAIKIDLTDEYEGTITLKTPTGKHIEAFFWGKEYQVNQDYYIQFSAIEYNLKWEIIFSENRQRIKSLVKESTEASYQAYGQIISINPVTVDFGDIIMKIGELTNDDKVIGEFILLEN